MSLDLARFAGRQTVLEVIGKAGSNVGMRKLGWSRRDVAARVGIGRSTFQDDSPVVAV